MENLEVLQVILFFAFLIGLTPLLGNYMSKVFSGEKHLLLPGFGGFKKLIYKVASVNPDEETNWKTYTISLLIFNATGMVMVCSLQLI